MNYQKRAWPHLNPDEQVADQHKLAWPDGQAVAAVLCFELWGSSVTASQAIAATTIDFGIRRGADAVIDLLGRYGLSATFFLNGKTVEQEPALAARVAEAGHDVAPLGHDLTPHWDLGDIEEREQINSAIAAITTATGVRPRGWRTPFSRPSAHTLGYLRDAGLDWDSSLRNDDVPCRFGYPTGSLIEIPFGGVVDYTTRSTFPAPVKLAPVQLQDYLDEIEVVRDESMRLPRLQVFNFNPSYTGRPAELAMLDVILQKLTSAETGTWFPTCSGLTDWMNEHDEWFADIATAREAL